MSTNPTRPPNHDLTRRGLLGLATVAGAAVALPSAAVGATDAGLPATMTSRGVAGTVQSPGFPVHHVALSWSGSASGVRLRTRRHGRWGAWRDVPACDTSGPRHRSLLHVGDAAEYDVEVGGGAGDPRVWAVNSVDGPRHRPAERARRWARTPYLSRAAWGADESLRFDASGAEIFPTEYFPIQTLTVHHTVTASSDPDPAATVRAVYAFQTLPPENFGDIGYHLLVDEHGRVYEGRYSGADPVPVLGSGGGASGMSNGAHVGGFNAGNVGVALLGDLTDRGPTAAARRSLVRVLAVLSAVGGLDPRGTTDYTNPISGDQRSVPTLSGHRDWTSTECPGDRFYPDLPGVRRDVARLLRRDRPRRAGTA